MFKIRDDVDLKELENYGFIKYQNIDDGKYYYCICDLFIGEDRKILQDDGINPCKAIEYQLNEIEIEILYDLIKANLVVKE